MALKILFQLLVAAGAAVAGAGLAAQVAYRAQLVVLNCVNDGAFGDVQTPTDYLVRAAMALFGGAERKCVHGRQTRQAGRRRSATFPLILRLRLIKIISELSDLSSALFEKFGDRGFPFLAMEFLHGEALDERLKREGKLPIPEVLRIGCEVAEALAAAQDEGLIHRDIKPANVWLEVKSEPRTKRGGVSGQSEPLTPLRSVRGSAFRCKILDFGLARAADDSEVLTQSGTILGTPRTVG